MERTCADHRLFVIKGKEERSVPAAAHTTWHSLLSQAERPDLILLGALPARSRGILLQNQRKKAAKAKAAEDLLSWNLPKYRQLHLLELKERPDQAAAES